MAWYPSVEIFASDGVSSVYTISQPIDIDPWPIDPASHIALSNNRSQGEIILPAGDTAYDLTIRGRLASTDYTALTTAIFNLRDTIVTNTRYVLKIDKSNSTTDDLNVMRLIPIIWDNGRGKRVKFIYYDITFRVNAWS